MDNETRETKIKELLLVILLAALKQQKNLVFRFISKYQDFFACPETFAIFRMIYIV